MDIKLNYLEKGSGEALILLHGNGEDGGYFASQIECFSSKYRVIAPDTRGHGKSPRGVGPFTLSRFADDLKDFLDALGIGKANVLGFSDGGNIALIFAIKHPGYVSRLILNGANLNPCGVKLSVMARMVLDCTRALASSAFGRDRIREIELLRLMIKEPRITIDELRRIDIPTLVIAGTDDMIKDAHTRRISENIAGSRLCIIEGSHFLAAEKSEEFNECVMRFLSGEK